MRRDDRIPVLDARCILVASAGLTDGQFRSRDTVTTRDLRGTLAHQLENEWAWRIRLMEGSFRCGGVRPTDYPTLDSLVTRWHSEERDCARCGGHAVDRLTRV
jgi:hypothetical protein